MQDFTPPRPTGFTREARFDQSTWDKTHGPSAQLRNSSTVKFQKSSRGITAKVIQSSKSVSFFHPFQIYKVGDFEYCVRGGFVATRPRHALPAGHYDFDTSTSEFKTKVLSGSDGVALVSSSGQAYDFYQSLKGPKAMSWLGGVVETVTVGNAGDFGVSDPLNSAKFVLNRAQDSTSDPGAAFFIKIDDTTDGEYPAAQIMCRMITRDSPSSNGRTNDFFPDECIPIGIVSPEGSWGSGIGATPMPLQVDQFLYRHVLNETGHYNCGNPFGNYSVQMPLWWIGEWSDDTNDDFAGKVYYPGDVVTTPTTVNTGYDLSSDPISLDFIQMWMKVAPFAVVSNSPESSPSGWQLICGFPGA